MTYHHAGDQPVYAPNSYGGPAADPARAPRSAGTSRPAELARTAYEKHAEDDDFGQPGTLVREVMDDAEREALVSDIVGHASDDVTPTCSCASSPTGRASTRRSAPASRRVWGTQRRVARRRAAPGAGARRRARGQRLSPAGCRRRARYAVAAAAASCA